MPSKQALGAKYPVKNAGRVISRYGNLDVRLWLKPAKSLQGTAKNRLQDVLDHMRRIAVLRDKPDYHVEREAQTFRRRGDGTG